MKIAKKYYVAADRVFRPGDTWAKANLEEAIEHARKLLEMEPLNNIKYIVKVVKVVKRKETPISVENVT